MVSLQSEKASGGPGRQWAIGGRQVITPDGARDGAVVVQDEKIVAVVSRDQLPRGCPYEDVGRRVILPGLVDTHVHVNEPGRTEWEGFASATRAAAAGGVTTLVDMPLNSSPVTTTSPALAEKLRAAEGKLYVDCGFYGGVVPGNADHITVLAGAGVLGFKAFLCHSGIDEFPNATESDLRAAMPAIAAAGLPLLVHGELLTPQVEGNNSDPRSYAAYLASRPRQWEHDAIKLLVGLAREYGCRVHIVHLSSADALPLIAEARSSGVPLTVETCPHYLYFAAEEIPDGDPRFKCAPPIRERDNRRTLQEALRAGLIDTIGSDHSPAPPALKHLESGDLQKAWGGIAALQLTLPIVWTLARLWPQTSLTDVARWMCTRPAELVGLIGRKGALAPGCDADLVVFDPEAASTVIGAELHHRHKLTPYEGHKLHGRVERTYLRGNMVYGGGRVEGTPRGLAILRQSASLPRLG
jgi:allantoinase